MLLPMTEDDYDAIKAERLYQQRTEEERIAEREYFEQQYIESEIEDQDELDRQYREMIEQDPYAQLVWEEYEANSAQETRDEKATYDLWSRLPQKTAVEIKDTHSSQTMPLEDPMLSFPQVSPVKSTPVNPEGNPPKTLSLRQTDMHQQETTATVSSKLQTSHIGVVSKATPYDVAQNLIKREHFVVIKDEIYWFGGQIYWKLSKPNALRLIVARCRAVVKEVGNGVFVEQVYKSLLQEPSICNNDLLPSSDEVVLLDGVLNLKTWTFFQHTPTVFATSFLTANFRRGIQTSCSRFDSFVKSIANGDPVLEQRIWEAFGYLLTQDQRGKAFVLLQGPTNSGKSVLGNFIRGCINKEAVSSLDLQSFGGRFDLADIIGKQLCIDMDLSSGAINERTASNLKKMTGGDQLSTDVKYKDRENIINTAKVLLSTNHHFQILGDADEALLQRIVVIPCTRTVPQSEQNFDLLACLEEERDAAVVKALAAYCNLRDRKYIFPGNYTLNAAVSGGGGLIDCIADFLFEDCIEADLWTPTSVFFEKFSSRFKPRCSINTFSEMLHTIVKCAYPSVTKNRRRVNGQGPFWGYQGLALRAGPPPTS